MPVVHLRSLHNTSLISLHRCHNDLLYGSAVPHNPENCLRNQKVRPFDLSVPVYSLVAGWTAPIEKLAPEFSPESPQVSDWVDTFWLRLLRSRDRVYCDWEYLFLKAFSWNPVILAWSYVINIDSVSSESNTPTSTKNSKKTEEEVLIRPHTIGLNGVWRVRCLYLGPREGGIMDVN